MIVNILQTEPGSGVNIVRMHGGVLVIEPPKPPVLAETPQEALGVLADWLGMRKPGRTIDGAPPLRFAWAAPKFECTVGSVISIARHERGNASREPGYILTWHYGIPPTLAQGLVWNAMSTLESVNAWMSSSPFHRNERMDAVRVVPHLDCEASDVFEVEVQPTALLPADQPAPLPDAVWTVAAKWPALMCGITDGAVCDHFTQQLAGDVSGRFAARLYRHTLEIGQRLFDQPDDGEESE